MRLWMNSVYFQIHFLRLFMHYIDYYECYYICFLKRIYSHTVKHIKCIHDTLHYYSYLIVAIQTIYLFIFFVELCKFFNIDIGTMYLAHSQRTCKNINQNTHRISIRGPLDRYMQCTRYGKKKDGNNFTYNINCIYVWHIVVVTVVVVFGNSIQMKSIV